MSRRALFWQLSAVLIVAAIVAVLSGAGVVRPWIGVAVAAIGVSLVLLIPGRRDVRMIRTIRERVETTVSAHGGTFVRHAGSDLERLSSSVGSLIKTAEAVQSAREASDREVDSILSTLGEGVVIADTAGGVYLVNDAARRMLENGGGAGMTRAPASIRRLVRHISSGAALATEVFEHGRPSRWLHATVKPVGERRALIVLHDVTANRQAAEIMKDFVADASHELKTPVAGILAASETIQSALPDEPETAATFAERLHDEALRLAALVSDLLDLSRLEADRPAMEVVSLVPIVETEFKDRRAAFDESGIGLESSLVEVKVRANAREIALAVGNLMENARVYSEAGSTVHVAVSMDDDRALVTVADQGSGIPARDLPRVFERFYRVDTARSRRSGGTGLGLAIVKYVAERHGGGVEVESALGVGSTFRFWIPKV
ncbi:MAG: ATP-binding protein [Acidimicrobiia bacterium]